MNDQIRNKGFLFFIMLFPLVDIFNGVFISKGSNIPLGTVYRILFIAYIFFGAFRKGIKQTGDFVQLFIVLFVLTAICIVQTVFFNTGLNLLVKELSYVIRFFLCLLIPFYAKQYKDQLSVNTLAKLTVVLDSFLIGGLIVPYSLGLGNSTYDDVAGFKGFYFATNDIAYAFLIMLFFLGWFLIKQNKRDIPAFLLVILYFLNMYCLLILGTKSGLLTGTIYSVYLIVHFLFRYRSRSMYEQFFIFEFLLGLLFFLLMRGKEFLLKSLSSIIARFTYFRVLYQDDWARLLLSSRNVYLRDAISNFLQTPNNLFIFLFGSGFENRWNWYGRRGGLIEMDFFDMFFSYGILGTTVLIAVMAHFLKISVNQGSRSFCVFLLFFTIVYSFLVGHVFFSALSATVFGFTCMFIQVIKEEQK